MTTPIEIDRDEYIAALSHDRGPFTEDIDPADHEGSLDGFTTARRCWDCWVHIQSGGCAEHRGAA